MYLIIRKANSSTERLSLTNDILFCSTESKPRIQLQTICCVLIPIIITTRVSKINYSAGTLFHGKNGAVRTRENALHLRHGPYKLRCMIA